MKFIKIKTTEGKEAIVNLALVRYFQESYTDKTKTIIGLSDKEYFVVNADIETIKKLIEVVTGDFIDDLP